MFRRRTPLTFLQKTVAFFWPRTGFSRATRYTMLRLKRLPGTPNDIASGFAFGAAISFTPFVGFHLIISAAFAWLFNVNVVAALVGTIIGNPWTFPFIWYGTYKLGLFFMASGVAATTKLDFGLLFQNLSHAVMAMDAKAFFADVWPVWLPMLVGSIPFVVLVWCGFYFGLRSVIAKFQHMRKVKRERRRLQIKKENRLRDKFKKLLRRFKRKARQMRRIESDQRRHVRKQARLMHSGSSHKKRISGFNRNGRLGRHMSTAFRRLERTSRREQKVQRKRIRQQRKARIIRRQLGTRL